MPMAKHHPTCRALAPNSTYTMLYCAVLWILCYTWCKGEESAKLSSNADGTLKMETGVPTWLIDPLDVRTVAYSG